MMELLSWKSFEGTLISHEHVAFGNMLCQFVDEEVVPLARDYEPEGKYPDELLPEARRLGLFAMTIDSQFGGQDADMVSFAIACEELGRGWAGFAAVVGSHSTGSWLINRYGSSAQKERWLPKLATENVSGIALTEPDAGSDLRAIRTVVVSTENDGGGLVLNGRKTMITHARRADPLMVLARYRGPGAPDGFVIVGVSSESQGITIEREIGKLGHRGVELCEIVFDNVQLDAADLLGEIPGNGLQQMKSALSRGRIYIAAASTGIQRAALEYSLAHAMNRQIADEYLVDLQTIQHKLARIFRATISSRLSYLFAAASIDQNRRADVYSAASKIDASEGALVASLEAMRIHGGAGFTTDLPIERLYRDSPIMAIGEGTNEVLSMLIARSLKRGSV